MIDRDDTYIEQAEYIVERTGVGNDSMIISVGAGEPVCPGQSSFVPWEFLFASAGATVLVIEPKKTENQLWQNYEKKLGEKPKGRITTFRSGTKFEDAKIRQGSVDVVVMMCVLSCLPVDTNSVIRKAVNILRPGGYLIVGWRNRLPEREIKSTQEALDIIRQEGYELKEIDRGSEPRTDVYSHDWICYNVIKTGYRPVSSPIDSLISKPDFFKIAADAYRGKVFSSGQTYLEHASVVAQELKKMAVGIDQLYIAAALLHHIPTSELNKVLKDIPELDKQQQAKLVILVEKMNRITQLPYLPPLKSNFSIQNQMNIIIQLAGAPEMMLLVFTDKLHTLAAAQKTEQVYLSREIADIYAPLAERLFLCQLAEEFLEQSFKFSHPEEYTEIESKITQLATQDKHQRQAYIEGIAKKTLSYLVAWGIEAKIDASIKYAYSVWNKIHINSKYERVEQLEDLFRIRIVFDTQEELWKAATISFNFGDPVPGQMQLKRLNAGYEAFHINVKTWEGQVVEFQSMTKENYGLYIYGQAAHWAYKLRQRVGQNFDVEQAQISGNFYVDFEAVRKSLERWVFVFKLEYEGQGKMVLRPLRLKTGAIPADFAAAREVDLLNKDYVGAASFTAGYDVHSNKLVSSRKIMRSEQYHLQPGK